MMRRVSLNSSARDDLESIQTYIAESAGVDTAARFIEQILSRCDHLASLPGTLGTAHTEIEPDLRSTPYKGYILYFRYAEDTLEIVHVLDARRNAPDHFAGDDREI